ncbi:PD40 domain-containing protein [Poritiphilus flavus]|uniref:WD40-like Beta Propeller Repeat n=1 Tax=Poritiphilus flavus TaxID=2697053 RepID=A0A6L9EG22_9FLAO|nr:PD40 domain-containing protein [Poritiphilus flavus]NAS13468.1 hypothetical protein [Poritiphilus flavus]
MSSQPGSCIVFVLLLAVFSCTSKTEDVDVTPKGPFFGVIPKDYPQLLAPELLASPLEEFNGTFNPEGTEFYYTTVVQENFSKGLISFTKLREDQSWTAPAVAHFSGEADDYDPLFNPDGSRLYFSSRRPAKDTLSPYKSNIWFIEREGEGWSAPVVLPFTKNDDYYSSLTRDGIIYFNVWSTGNLFKAIPDGKHFEVKELDSTINRPYDQGDPFVSPDEDYLIFRGYGNDALGRGDLYISFNIDGNWTLPENLGEPINSRAHEMCPYVSSDGSIFIFASGRLTKAYNTSPLTELSGIQEKFRTGDNGELNLYYMSTDFIERLRQKHLDAK